MSTFASFVRKMLSHMNAPCNKKDLFLEAGTLNDMVTSGQNFGLLRHSHRDIMILMNTQLSSNICFLLVLKDWSKLVKHILSMVRR